MLTTDNRMTEWPSDWVTEWPSDRSNDQMTGWQDDRKLRRRLTGPDGIFFHLMEYPQNWEIWSLSLASIQSSRSILSVAVHSKMTKAVDANGLVVWRCEECGHESRRSGDLSKHIEAKHLRCAGFNCEFCGKFCPSKNALTSHVSRNHRSSSIMWFYLWVRSVSNLCCKWSKPKYKRMVL